MRLQTFYLMSEDEVVRFLVEGNTTTDNHFMNFLDLLKTVWYPIIILLRSIVESSILSFLGDVEFEVAVPDSTLGRECPLLHEEDSWCDPKRYNIGLQ